MFVIHATRQAALLALLSTRYCASQLPAATFLQQSLLIAFDVFSNPMLLHWYRLD